MTPEQKAVILARLKENYDNGVSFSDAVDDVRETLAALDQCEQERDKTREMLIREAEMQEDQPSTLYDVAASVVYAAKRFQRQRDELAEQLTAAGQKLAQLHAAQGRLIQERDELLAALKPFAPGFHNGVWGRIKAFIVNGAPTREEGIALARQITEWQVAIPESVYIADGDRVRPFAGTDVMDGDEGRS